MSHVAPKQSTSAEELWNEILEQEEKEKLALDSVNKSKTRKKSQATERLVILGSKESSSSLKTKQTRKATETPKKESKPSKTYPLAAKQSKIANYPQAKIRAATSDVCAMSSRDVLRDEFKSPDGWLF
ncbi:hypothetical protein RSOL_510200, partial [Rhizoctonia solani AG-3 Rhs1AP]